MRCFVLVLLLANVATVAAQKGPTFDEYKAKKANETADVDAEMAKQAKMSAVDKILAMLEDVQTKVMAEGEAEAKTYNEFACFCKDTIAEKSAAIQAGKDEKADLEASIEADRALRVKQDRRIQELLKDIEYAHSNVTASKEIRAQELAAFKANLADVDAGLVALQGAIEALKASKAPAKEVSMLQLKPVAQTVRTAALIADSLGLIESDGSGPMAAFLQQAPDVPMENYNFHSNDIITTLEKLQESFQKTKIDLDEEEVKAVQAHNMYLQKMDALIKDLNGDLDTTKAKKQETIAKIQSESEQLSTVSAQLLDDQQYLEKLAEMCQDKKKTWDQRSSTRADELHTLTQVIGILEGAVSNKTTAATVRFSQAGVSLKLAKAVALDKSAMESLEAAAEAAEAPSFLQSVQRHLAGKPMQDGRQVVIDMLKTKGQKLKSEALTALANQLSQTFDVDGQDPFAKVKQLIQELIERLLQEAANEANQKGWCDKATSAATQKRDYAVEEIRGLNAEMAELEALRDKLAEELEVLNTQIDQLVEARKEAEDVRAKEKAENEFTIEEAKAGLEAIGQAMDILDKWYKTNAKNEVSLLQQSPEEDAPDAGFDNFEAYKGAQAESGGILGMMEVIASDFTRTITETEKAEAEAEQLHLEFMTETGKSLGEKTMIRDQKDKEKDNAEEDLQAADDKLQAETKTLQTSLTELIELTAACIDTGTSYEDRVARREEEIEALKKALCILGAYQKYGPDGMGDAC